MQQSLYNQEKSQHLKSNQKESGCIGHALISCIDFIFSVGDHFSYERRLVEDQLKSSDRTDINGKRISGAGSISVGTYSIQYNSSRIVVSVRMMKFYIIDNAETFDEYRETGLYDMLRIAIGDSCPDEEAVYKFFQNSVKPKIKNGGALSEGYSKFYHSYTDPIQFNGYLLKYQRSYGRDINDITYDNRSGQFRTSSITALIIVSSTDHDYRTPER
ncbi:MAG: hypothetical protein HQL90_11930, partial [Magnetococcales bacterium]|nr:hypothetical protein [Magnetococcales bacterium]